MKLYYLGNHRARMTLRPPLYLTRVQTEILNPEDDYMNIHLDFNKHLIKHESATFYCRVTGNSMKGSGIHNGDLLIVDRVVKPHNGSIVLANVDGELTCKVLDINNQRLLSSNVKYPPINIGDQCEFSIEGVVIHSIRSHDRVG